MNVLNFDNYLNVNLLNYNKHRTPNEFLDFLASSFITPYAL